MHIVFLSDNFPPETNAAATRVYERACYWVKWGFQVTVITSAPNFPQGKVYPPYQNKWFQTEKMDGIHIIRVKTFIAPNQGFVLRTLDFLSFMISAFFAGLFPKKPDLIVSTSPQFFCAVSGWLLSAVRRKPFVFELSDLWPDSIMGVTGMKKNIFIRAIEKVELFLYRRSAAVIALTQAFKENLVQRGIAAEKIDVVRNGVDLSRYHPQEKDSFLIKHYRLENKFIVGYIGTHGMAHALKNVLEAALLLKEHPEIVFMFVGDGAERNSLIAYSEKRRLSNVIFIASQPKKMMPAFLSLCDIFLVHLKNSSIFSTVIPSKIFEAMGMGLPILFSGPRGEASNIIEEHQIGLCIPAESSAHLAEAITQLHGDKKLLKKLAENSQNSSVYYQREHQSKEMIKTFQKITTTNSNTINPPHKIILQINRIKRILKKPPRVILNRLWQEAKSQVERYISPRRARSFNLRKLLKETGCSSLPKLWRQLSQSPFATDTQARSKDLLTTAFPDYLETIFKKAVLAQENKVDLLGTGLIDLGKQIDWNKDYKTGIRWENQYCHDIEYINLERRSDVKIPWEISRMQWMIPLGQAYLLTQDDQYALAVKNILLDWIDANPYAGSVNWSCTMEAALRIIVWCWFFHVFKTAPSWQDPGFQKKFLISLYLHGDFAVRNLEQSDINGNHLTADAAGLVFAGLFFKSSAKAKKWLNKGWDILTQEIKLQIADDGVDYEASVPYHRLVFELFFFPALYREKCGLSVPEDYYLRLKKMAEYTAAYSRKDGSTPLLGDADDARVLPFGNQPLNDHRYLLSFIEKTGDRQAESYWLYGEEILKKPNKNLPPPKCTAFINSGYYIMANERDHIFIDCAPVGLAGRGGHGHNDCLSFEAMLDGELLISDSGAYLYTASYQERNYFRSTAAHNTPQIDGEEINRFESPYHLWTLHNDAKPTLLFWEPGKTMDHFSGSHNGYHRLKDPVGIQRDIYLLHDEHALIIKDKFTAKMPHTVRIPLHLAPGVYIEKKDDEIILSKNGKKFNLLWTDSEDWQVSISEDRISPSYGVIQNSQTIVWKKSGKLSSFKLTIKPAL